MDFDTILIAACLTCIFGPSLMLASFVLIIWLADKLHGL